MIYVTHDQVEAMTMGDRICVMNLGNIMQVDTPLNLYHYPQNKFVAGFIGSPSMNLLESELIEDKGNISVKIGGIKLALPEDKAKKVKNYVGKMVWFGSRPEYINLGAEESNDTVIGTVEVLEHMGNESYIHFNVQGQQFTSRIDSLDSKDLHVGNEQIFRMDMEKCHIFDYTTEENISL